MLSISSKNYYHTKLSQEKFKLDQKCKLKRVKNTTTGKAEFVTEWHPVGETRVSKFNVETKLYGLNVLMTKLFAGYQICTEKDKSGEVLFAPDDQPSKQWEDMFDVINADYVEEINTYQITCDKGKLYLELGYGTAYKLIDKPRNKIDAYMKEQEKNYLPIMRASLNDESNYTMIEEMLLHAVDTLKRYYEGYFKYMSHEIPANRKLLSLQSKNPFFSTIVTLSSLYSMINKPLPVYLYKMLVAGEHSSLVATYICGESEVLDQKEVDTRIDRARESFKIKARYEKDGATHYATATELMKVTNYDKLSIVYKYEERLNVSNSVNLLRQNFGYIVIPGIQKSVSMTSLNSSVI